MMKKTLILSLMFATGIANANVLCNVITKDPRYNVGSYVRSQTACRTTTHAGISGLGPQLLRLGALGILVSIIASAAKNHQQEEINISSSTNYIVPSSSNYIIPSSNRVLSAREVEAEFDRLRLEQRVDSEPVNYIPVVRSSLLSAREVEAEFDRLRLEKAEY